MNTTPIIEDYIKQLLTTDTGVVSEDLHILEIEPFLSWVKENCHYTGMVNEQTMRELAYSFKGLNKIRYFWVNAADFTNVSTESVNDNEPAYVASKNIDEFVVVPDEGVKRGEFWFCTTDEWMILKHS